MMRLLNKIDAWFSQLAFKWQAFIAMAAIFSVLALIMAAAG